MGSITRHEEKMSNPRDFRRVQLSFERTSIGHVGSALPKKGNEQCTRDAKSPRDWGFLKGNRWGDRSWGGGVGWEKGVLVNDHLESVGQQPITYQSS